jgi:hypothetical protein
VEADATDRRSCEEVGEVEVVHASQDLSAMLVSLTSEECHVNLDVNRRALTGEGVLFDREEEGALCVRMRHNR